MARYAVIEINDSSNVVLIGIRDWDRANGGVFIPARVANAAARLALTPETDELVYQIDEETFYRWDGSAWQAQSVNIAPGTLDHGAVHTPASLLDDDHTIYLLATGARAGATSQAQSFGALGILADLIVEATANAGVSIAGQRHFGSLASAPAPAGGAVHGDRYFDTTIAREMYYDDLAATGNRGKWLSVETFELEFNRNGNVGGGAYFRRGFPIMALGRGFTMKYDATVVEFEYARQDTSAAAFDLIDQTGTVLVNFPTSALNGSSITLDADASQGDILAVRNAPGSTTINDGTGKFIARWRR